MLAFRAQKWNLDSTIIDVPINGNPAVHRVQAGATAILSGMTSFCVSHFNILTFHIFY